MRDPKLRFSNRATDYAKYRPGYPREILSFLEEKCGLTNGSVVADVGSGTGILSELLLQNGNRVLGVEPNEEMRRAAEGLLGPHPCFESVAGAAEATTLADGSVDLIIVGNSFHWFDHEATQAEFSRVLKPAGRVAVVWNVPRKTGVPFLEDFERLLSEHRMDYSGVEAASEEEIYERTETIFRAGGFETARFPNIQPLDFEGLKGLVLSYSNVPAEGDPGSGAMLRDLKGVFHAHESGGQVTVEYVVRVYCGSLR